MKAKSILLPMLFGGLLLALYNLFFIKTKNALLYIKTTDTLLYIIGTSFAEGALFVLLPYLAVVATSRVKSLSYLENTVVCILVASILAGIFRILLIPNAMFANFTIIMLLYAFILQSIIVAISLILTNLFDK